MNHRCTAQRSLVNLTVILLLIALLLSACSIQSIDFDLTLYPDDRFDAHTRITLPAAALALVGSEALEAQFEEMEQQAVGEGVKFSWRKERSGSADEVAYSIGMSGTGYDNLSEFGIEVEKIQFEGKEALSVSASSPTDLYGAQSTFRLHVGKIIQTNNRRDGNSTIVWTGNDVLQAIVTPKGGTNWFTTILVILGVAAVVVIAFVFLRRRSLSPMAAVAPITGRGAFCPHCGQPTLPDAKFCMSCGQSLSPM